MRYLLHTFLALLLMAAPSTAATVNHPPLTKFHGDGIYTDLPVNPGFTHHFNMRGDPTKLLSAVWSEAVNDDPLPLRVKGIFTFATVNAAPKFDSFLYWIGNAHTGLRLLADSTQAGINTPFAFLVPKGERFGFALLASSDGTRATGVTANVHMSPIPLPAPALLLLGALSAIALVAGRRRPA